MPTSRRIRDDSTPTFRSDLLKNVEILDLNFIDFAIALITSAVGFGVLWLGLEGYVAVPVVLLLYCGVVAIPAGFLVIRRRQGSDLAIPGLLLITTFAAGPLGAAGTAVVALMLSRDHPTPHRLLDWYSYITGIVERDRATQIYDDLASERLPDHAAGVSRFAPILNGTSFDHQQRVLGIMGSRYHADFRHVLRRALRSRNGLIRAQAAAIASSLDFVEKSQLSAPELEKNRDPALPDTDKATTAQTTIFGTRDAV